MKERGNKKNSKKSTDLFYVNYKNHQIYWDSAINTRNMRVTMPTIGPPSSFVTAERGSLNAA